MRLSGKESVWKRECVTVLVFFLRKLLGLLFLKETVGILGSTSFAAAIGFCVRQEQTSYSQEAAGQLYRISHLFKVVRGPTYFFVSYSLCCRCISVITYIKCDGVLLWIEFGGLKVFNSIAFDCFCKWIVFCWRVWLDGVFHLNIFLLWICDWCHLRDWFDVFKLKSLKPTKFFFGRYQIICR